MWSKAVLGVAATLLSSGLLLADVLHLKDGRSLTVESWSYRGDQVVFEIAAGSVTIPRSLVVSIESTSSGSPATEAPHPGPAPVPARRPATRRRPAPAPSASRSTPPPAPVSEALSEAELERAVAAFKDDLGGHPRRREADSREIARGLSLLALRRGEKRDLAGAEGLYREALTYDSRCLPAWIGLSVAYLRDGKDLYARAGLQEALASYPDNATLHDLLGTTYYRQENVADAVSEWEISLSLKSDPQVAARLEKARRELAVDHGYSRVEAPHFTLRYEGGGTPGEVLEGSIRDYLEERYKDLSGRFQYQPRAPIIVILYPSRVFHELTRLPASVEGLFDGKIRIPVGGLKALNPQFRAVLAHELTHAFVYGKTGGNCPRWLQEGLAQLVEERPLLPSEERELARDLAASDGKSWYKGFTYPSSLSFTRYLEERFGFGALVEALNRMGAGLSAEEALKEATREDFASLQRGWMDDLLKKFAEGS